jgi:hypothetical protein
MRTLYTWINNLNALFWERVVRSTALGAESLSAFRVVFSFFLLVTHTPFNWIAAAPRALFNPPVLSLANLFDGFPGRAFFMALDVVSLLSLACLAVGIRARTSTIVYLLAAIIGQSFQYSFGKIDHPIMLYVLLGCMSFSGWGQHLAVLPDKKTKTGSTTRSLSLLGVLLCFAMFTAGFEKALNWVDFDLTTNGFISWFRLGYYVYDRQFLLAHLVNYFPPLVLESFDYAAVALELSPLFFLLHSRKGWRVWLLIVCTFHLVNTLLLNIAFIENTMVYLVFVDFTGLYHKLRSLVSGPVTKRMVAGGLMGVVIAKGVFIFGIVSPLAFVTFGQLKMFWLCTGLFIWAGAIIVIARSITFGWAGQSGAMAAGGTTRTGG